MIYSEDFESLDDELYSWEQIEAAWDRVYPESLFTAPLIKLKEELQNDE